MSTDRLLQLVTLLEEHAPWKDRAADGKEGCMKLPSMFSCSRHMEQHPLEHGSDAVPTNVRVIREQMFASQKASQRKGCAVCNVRVSARWRRGPTGPHSLCNRCGVYWATMPHLWDALVGRFNADYLRSEVLSRGSTSMPGVSVLEVSQFCW
jgi:hypothetical protein